MECRAGLVVLVVMIAAVSLPPGVCARRRVVIEVPVHIRSHQHTHTVYRPLPVAPAAPAAPAAPQALVFPAQPYPATLASHRSAAQRVAHHAAPGGLTSITLVNLGRHTPSQADDGVEGDAEETPQRHRQPPPPQQPQYNQHNQQRHHVSGVNYQRTEHTAQVY